MASNFVISATRDCSFVVSALRQIHVYFQALRLLLHDAEPRISCSFLVLWPRRSQSSLLWHNCELRWLVLRSHLLLFTILSFCAVTSFLVSIARLASATFSLYLFIFCNLQADLDFGKPINKLLPQRDAIGDICTNKTFPLQPPNARNNVWLAGMNGIVSTYTFPSLLDSPPVKPFLVFAFALSISLGGLTFRLLALSRALSFALALRRLWLGLALLLARLLSFARTLSIPRFRSFA